MDMNSTDRCAPGFVVALTGASGMIYGLRLLEALLKRPLRVDLMVSAAGARILAYENGMQNGDLAALLEGRGGQRHRQARLHVHGADDLFAPPASGSFLHRGMVVAPCSMKTLAAVANGTAGDLISRSADVALKERRPLILVVREMPLSLVHIDNMARATRAGATILPACPSFYSRPASIEALVDTVVARILDQLGLAHRRMRRWGEDSDG